MPRPSPDRRSYNVRVANVDRRPKQHLDMKMDVMHEVKDGKQVRKTAELLAFGSDPENPSSTKLQLKAHWTKSGKVVDKSSWYCEGEEIEALIAFLTSELPPAPGQYMLVKNDRATDELLLRLQGLDLTGPDALELATTLAGKISELTDIAGLEAADLLSTQLELQHKRSVVERLRSYVDDPTTLEGPIQELIEENWWLLGASYVRLGPRRSIAVTQEHDIVLERADSVMHIIELKRPGIPNLVISIDGGGHCVGHEINKAVGQALSYLRYTDEHRAHVKDEFGADFRRAQATVLIGHPQHCESVGVTEAEVRSTIRTYNSHLARVEVLTYEDVLAAADRTLGFLGQKLSERDPHPRDR
jgi:hypothetical protein